MTVSSDITNLFKQFGGSPEHYQELSTANKAPAASKRPQAAQIDPISPSASEAPAGSVAERQPSEIRAADMQPGGAAAFAQSAPEQPVPEQAKLSAAAAAAAAVADDSAWSKGSLQRLLEKLVREERREVAAPASVDPAAVAPVPSLDHLQVLAVVSANGGVGKSTLVANLAVAAQARGSSVLALDLAPQDALQHHFRWDEGASRNHVSGIATADGAPAKAVIRTCSGVSLLPFGRPGEAGRLAFEAELQRDPRWLARQLAALDLPAGSLVILDTPAGPSSYLCQALSVASSALVVCRADAASYNALAQITGLIGSVAVERGDAFRGAAYLLNQREADCPLDRNIGRILQELLGEQILGEVRRDPSIAEALVYNLSALEHAPDAQGSDDLRQLATCVLARLSSHFPARQLS